VLALAVTGRQPPATVMEASNSWHIDVRALSWSTSTHLIEVDNALESIYLLAGEDFVWWRLNGAETEVRINAADSALRNHRQGSSHCPR
jgi:hypothetical protein